METEIEVREELRKRLVEHRLRNQMWGRISFYIAQAFGWLAVVGSFAAAVLSAVGGLNKIVLAVVAGIPAIVIVVDRRFAFAQRAQWHNLLGARVEGIENSLLFEGKSVHDASKELSRLLEAMTDLYPPTIPHPTIPTSANEAGTKSGPHPG